VTVTWQSEWSEQPNQRAYLSAVMCAHVDAAACLRLWTQETFRL